MAQPKSVAPRRVPDAAPAPLHPADRETVVAMVTASVEFQFDRSSANFREMPSAERFAALNEAMCAFQFWRGKLPEAKAKLAGELYVLPVTQWGAYLRNAAHTVLPTD